MHEWINESINGWTGAEEEQAAHRKKEEEYKLQTNLSKILLTNLCDGLQSASTNGGSIDKSKHEPISVKKEQDNNNTAVAEPPIKRIKTEKPPSTSSSSSKDVKMKSKEEEQERDLFAILDPSFSKGKDVVHLPGAIIARLTIGGIVNAVSGTLGGIVSSTSAKPTEGNLLKITDKSPIPKAGNVTLENLRLKAIGLSHVIAARLEIDMMSSTPKRIIEMLVPEMTLVELNNIRRRIYDTVILGRGTNASANAAALERTEHLPVAARVGQHDIDKVRIYLRLLR